MILRSAKLRGPESIDLSGHHSFSLFTCLEFLFTEKYRRKDAPIDGTIASNACLLCSLDELIWTT